MKQIDIIRTYAQKRCLVVDENPESRSNIKRLLIDFGVVSADTAGKAEEALELCQRNQYDLVIAEHNLGIGKSGQQLLEELRLHHWLSLKSLFILMSSDSNAHDVLHAIENQPDDFISKPINKASLRPRLDQTLLKAEALHKIKEKLDEGQTELIIKLCLEFIAQNNQYQNDARRILGETYLNQNALELAAVIYHEANDFQKSSWADIGLAKVLLEKEEFEASKKLTLDTLEIHPLCTEAMDLLTKIYEKQKQPKLAQQTLEKALAATPKSILRHRHMGRISSDINDIQRAAGAYRSATKLSRNSSFETPHDYLDLAMTLQKLAESDNKNDQNDSNQTDDNSSNKNELIKEANQALKSAKKKSHQHPVLNMHRLLIEVKILRLQNKIGTSNQLTYEAIRLLHSMNPKTVTSSCPRLCIDCASNFISLDEYIFGERLLKCLNRAELDDVLNSKIDNLLKTTIVDDGSALAKKINQKGIRYYQENKLDEAIKTFQSVLSYLPNQSNVQLNLAQALIGKNKLCALDENQLNTLNNCFKNLKKNRDELLQSNRYTYLKKQFEKIMSVQDSEQAG